MARRGALLVLGVTLLVGGLDGAVARGSTPAVLQAWAATAPALSFVPQPGHAYVSSVAASPETQTYVRLPELRQPDAGELVLREASDALLPQRASIAACGLAQRLVGTGQLAHELAVDCRIRVDLVRSPDGSWRVPLALLTESADSRRNGFGLIPVPASPGATWRVSFDTTLTRWATPHSSSAPPAVRNEGAAASGYHDVLAPTRPEGRDLPDAVVWAAPEAPVVPDSSGPREEAAPALLEEVSRFAWPRLSSASHPASAHVLLVMLLVAGGVLGCCLVAGRRSPDSENQPQSSSPTPAARSHRVVGYPLVAAVAAVASLAPESVLFKIGLVLIVAVGATGLHILVNWAGELSLAHAGFVGVPAFAVAQAAVHTGWSPLYLIPFGVVSGGCLGCLVGLPSLRAKGLQVALVTLAAGVAINSYLFTRPWLVGPPQGLVVPVPRIGPLHLASAQSLYPFLLCIVALATLCATVLYRSRWGRGMLWLRVQPEAAAAFGVPVSRYKLLAYVVAGSYSGLAGALTVRWVQTVTPMAFPLSLSFTYLMIVVLAGRGFLGGVFAAAAVLEGGRLFVAGAGPLVAYGGPICLLLVLTRYRRGFNGIGDSIMRIFPGDVVSAGMRALRAHLRSLRAGVVLALACLLTGGTMIGLSSYHLGNTDQLWIQNQEIVSGGIGGLAMVLLGIGLLLRDALVQGQRRVVAQLELLLAPRELPNDIAQTAPAAAVSPRRARRLPAQKSAKAEALS